jgi:Zn-dependent peptidase ImmA (M78 family)
LLRKAKAFQLNLAELTQGRNPAPRLITRALRFPDDISIDGLAGRVRDYLGITLTDQSGWPDDETALKAWQKSLHDVGIFVFKDAFRVEGYSGFSLYDDLFPIIYVNNSSTKSRQIFTLFHELAHLLFHTSGIDTLDDRYIPRLSGKQKRIEILCNQFAAQFLVPEMKRLPGVTVPNNRRTVGGALPCWPRGHLPQIPRSPVD